MSLYKQLWLSIALMMSVAFIGSLIVSSISTKRYLEEQLFRKNIDNVSSLALSLSKSDPDPLTSELIINSQFDTGHYEFIKLEFTDGQVIEARVGNQIYNEAPRWLVQLFPLESKPGFAQVSNGWMQIGKLSLSSHVRFGYKQLWDNCKRLFYYFIVLAALSAAIGTLILGIIIRPLDKTVEQAMAIGERRFITTNEPRTKEFKQVVRSMNKLSAHVKKMLDEESAKLDKWRKDSQKDATTGLLNRDPTLGQLRSLLERDDDSSNGTIITLRLHDLFNLNKSEGRQTMDSLLKRFGQSLLQSCQEWESENAFAGRLNGSDFLIVLPKDTAAEESGKKILDQLVQICRELDLTHIQLLSSCTGFQHGETVSDLLTRLDSVLDSAADKNTDSCVHVPSSKPVKAAVSHDQPQWKEFLTQAIANKQFVLDRFPVNGIDGNTLHYEAPVRLTKEDGSLMMAGEFMPHISRLQLGSALDLIVVELALDTIEKDHVHMGINLSAGLLSDTPAMEKLANQLKSFDGDLSLLWLEVPEFGAFQNITGFRILCQLLAPLDCVLGIEHVSQEVTRIGELHDLGLSYIKIDRSLIHDVNDSVANQVFLRGFCTIVHSIGLQAIAEGVSTEAEWNALKELGIDGGTGTYFPKEA